MISSINPANGELLKQFQPTASTELTEFFFRARTAQKSWALLSVQKRADYLKNLRQTIIHNADDLIEIISKENGKPKFEALSTEIIPVVELITYFAKKSPKLLREKKIPLRNPILLHKKSTLHFQPLGVIAVISPWNFPFLLPFGEIIMALVSGNAVIFKPSEVSCLVGSKIQSLCDEAGIPPFLVQTIYGAGDIGAELVKAKPDKVFFTGSPATGKKIMAAAAENLTPVNLELGGKDPLIVMPDSNLDFATSVALWGSFANNGQICASIERLIVHERIAEEFTLLLKNKIATLTTSDPSKKESDLGSITYEKQKSIYKEHLREAKEAGATFVTGGALSGDERFFAPTLVTGPDIEKLKIYRDETFGPTVALTRFHSPAEAIQKANDTVYGLNANIVTRNLSQGEEMAKQLQVGTVCINDTTYTAGVPETPWGGMKESGFGRKHSDMGLMEFVNVKHIHAPRNRLFRNIKGLWWYPYTPFQYQTFRAFLNLYHRGWVDKVRALPIFLWNFVQFMKKEKRI